ncbi:MAG TPA: DNA methyltransferase, partial [Polyangiaceae bacterium]
MARSPGRGAHLTFQGNLRQTRYGWLRLTPAYSVHLVRELLDQHWKPEARVLDPFCGTGTTALVCAERGIRCDTADINPFLLWLTRVKTTPYPSDLLEQANASGKLVERAIRCANGAPPLVPPIYQIEKWWSSEVLSALGRGMAAIRELESNTPDMVVNLLRVAFCRVMIGHANVSFGHQSMSFKSQQDPQPQLPFHRAEQDEIADSWSRTLRAISQAAESRILAVPTAIQCDARDLVGLGLNQYDCVITSPPYPNRMSYIRELRPYMYWLGYLTDGRQAGELDWQAIGGTWGSATSNVSKWLPNPSVKIAYPGFEAIIEKISARSDTLGRYVAKYFQDMVSHTKSLFFVVKPGGTIHYIVGNSKFYDVTLPVERIYAQMFEAAGFAQVTVETIRKRTSKKEL